MVSLVGAAADECVFARNGEGGGAFSLTSEKNWLPSEVRRD